MKTENDSSENSPTSTVSQTPKQRAWRPPLQHGTHQRHPKFERVSTIFQRVRQSVSKRTDLPELPFGIESLDELTRGLWKGKLTVLAARSSQGKTSFALQTAWNLADNGKTIAFLTLEDDREEIVERLWCHVAGVDNQSLRRGELPPEDPVLIDLFDKIKLLVLDNYGYNLPEIARVVDVLKPKPDVLVVDYAQMVDDDHVESEYRAISLFVRHLKLFAEQNEIAVLLCSQINRQGAQEGRPSIHHLARCGRLEEVANTILLLYWPFGTHDKSFDYQIGQPGGFSEDQCPHDYYEIEVAKNKTGPKGTVRLQFEGSKYRFSTWRDNAGTGADQQNYAPSRQGDSESY